MMMINVPHILLPLMLAAVTPLTEVQQVKLETANDRSRTIDEAAFYALLDNAEAWTGLAEMPPRTPPDDRIVVPDYQDMADNPEDWRGQLCRIEGKLQIVHPVTRLGDPKWEGIEQWSILAPDGTIVIVYLTDPPETTRSVMHPEVVEEFNRPVVLVARYYKQLAQPSRGQGMMVYPAFVGRTISEWDETAGGTGWGRGMEVDPIVIAVALLLLGYGAIRFYIWRRKRASQYSLSDRLRERKRQTTRALVEEEEDEDEELPEDLTSALEQLAQPRDEPEN